jgi:hypothetical protein
MIKGFDLIQPFSSLVEEQDQKHPELHLAANLNKVGVVLGTYAESLKLPVEKLLVLHICVDDSTLHPDLASHIDSLPISKEYKGQNRSRMKMLAKNLPWPVKAGGHETPNISSVKELVPEHLRAVWCLLSRVRHIRLGRRSVTGEEPDAYLRFRASLPLSIVGISLATVLLEVSKRNKVSDTRQLLEEHADDIKEVIKEQRAPSQWIPLMWQAWNFRRQVREYLGYPVEQRVPTALKYDELPEPLKTQINIYEDRALNGFKSDIDIKIRARTKYKLELSGHTKTTITNYIQRIRLGLGYVPREMYGDTLDVRELLTLVAREVEVEEVTVTELYSPIVDFYRRRELTRSSDRKEEGFDSRSFDIFVEAITAVAAYNGFLELRRKFLKVYETVSDVVSKNNEKRCKKEVFDRPWLDGQIKRLTPRFLLIATEGTFKSSTGTSLTKDQRYNLNFCLFYVALLTLRFLGVRQQCIRDCAEGENITFGRLKSVVFQWTDEEIKNGKGIRHCLNMTDHEETHKLLIDGVWTYHKHIYAYISGNDMSQPLHIRALRQKGVAGQFFLKCTRNGLCVPFNHAVDFHNWFVRQALTFLDFEGRIHGGRRCFGPHFLRAMFSDWVRFVLMFSREEGAQLVGDCPETFETDYVTHPLIYDTTAAWTEKNKEIRRKKRNKLEEP